MHTHMIILNAYHTIISSFLMYAERKQTNKQIPTGIVTFSDTKSLFWVCLGLLRDPLLRRKIEKRSINFIAHQQRSFSEPSALSKLSTAMVNLRNYLYGKEYEQPAVSKSIEYEIIKKILQFKYFFSTE